MNSDPEQMARDLAAFVKANHLDGVDVDYEQVRDYQSGAEVLLRYQ
jgi:hypothetical protein